MKTLLSLFLIFILLTSTAAASLTIYKTPLSATNPPGTERLIGGPCKIDYTATAASKCDPTLVQFKDLSKGTVTYICWEFGDGSYLISKPGQQITYALKNPVHKFPKRGYYIGMLAIKTKEYGWKLWVHKTVIIK